MISIADYFGKYGKTHKDVTPPRYASAQRLLLNVNKLMQIAIDDGVEFPINPKTKSQVAGETNGGFRPQDCTIGAPLSAHKICQAVDLYDPHGLINKWVSTSKIAKDAYESLGIYFENNKYTPTWSHWQIKQPKSGNRFFKP